MNTRFCQLRNTNVMATCLMAGILLAACSGPQSSTPRQVETSYPSVTYTYENDDQLIQAGQRAATYCTQYSAIPQTKSFGNEAGNIKTVIFECIPTTAPAAPSPVFTPNLTYTYRTDQELVDAARNAQIYCMNQGSQQVISNVSTNMDGSKTVTFRCSLN